MKTETKTCQNCKHNFVIESEDFDFYKKIQVPAPTFCPECRAIRRMIFWNQRQLFRKKEARTGKEIFSTYPEKAKIEIYDHDFWWSDQWNPMEFGMPVDFSKPFLEQLRELILKMPWPSRSIRGLVNSDYCNQASDLKNCYLCFNIGYAEDSLYSIAAQRLHYCLDIYAGLDMDFCYEIYQGGKCFQCFFSSDINNCRDVWFSRDCVDCSNCFGCINLRHKQYCWFNEQLTKEEYKRRFKDTWNGSFSGLTDVQNKFSDLWLRLPHKYLHGLQNVNVSGDYVYRSKNALDVFEVGGLEDVRYSENLAPVVKDSYDYTNWGENAELVYEVASSGDSCRNIKFCFDCWPAMQDSEYCLNCHSSSYLFGCVGLRSKEYCILNKQYTKDEYEIQAANIIQYMMTT